MIEQIKELLLDKHYDFVVAGDVTLKDRDSQMEVVIRNNSCSVLRVNVPDKGQAHIGILASKKDYKKSCDKLVFAANDDSLDVYFIELKESINLSRGDIPLKACNQIIYTTPVWDYLCAKVKSHFDMRHQRTQPKLHRVIITEKLSTKFDKQGIKSQSSKIVSYKGEKYKIIIAPNISLDDLKC